MCIPVSMWLPRSHIYLAYTMVLTHLLIGPPPQKLPGSSWFLSFKTRINDPHLDQHQHFVLFFLTIFQLFRLKNRKISGFFASLSSWSTLRAPTLRNWSCDVPRCLPSCRASCWRPCKATEAAEWRIEKWEGMKHQIFKITKMGIL